MSKASYNVCDIKNIHLYQNLLHFVGGLFMRKVMTAFKIANVCLAVALIAIAFTLFKTHAFTVAGHRLNTNYVFSFIPDSDLTEATIEHLGNSANSWNNAAGITLMNISGQRHSEVGYPRDDNKHYVYKERRTDITVPGQTKCYYSAWPHEDVLLSADVLLNSVFPFTNRQSPAKYDTWTVFIHEAGHVAGLDHTSLIEDMSIVMNPVTPANYLRRVLQPDDINGVKYIYNN